jgi:hypothetical protein
VSRSIAIYSLCKVVWSSSTPYTCFYRAVAESCDIPEDQGGLVSTSPFSVLVDYEDADDPSTLKSIGIRNWLVSERVLSAMTEALASCSHLTSIRLAASKGPLILHYLL